MPDAAERIAELQREVASNPASRQFYQLGELLRREGRADEAVSVLRTGLVHHPRYVAAWVSLGRALIEMTEAVAAAKVLQRAIELDTQNPVAWRLLGEARLMQGNRLGALSAMQKALDLAPGDEMVTAAVEALAGETLPPGSFADVPRGGAAPAAPLHAATRETVQAVPASAKPDAAPSAAAIFLAPALPVIEAPPPVPAFEQSEQEAVVTAPAAETVEAPAVDAAVMAEPMEESAAAPQEPESAPFGLPAAAAPAVAVEAEAAPLEDPFALEEPPLPAVEDVFGAAPSAAFEVSPLAAPIPAAEEAAVTAAEGAPPAMEEPELPAAEAAVGPVAETTPTVEEAAELAPPDAADAAPSAFEPEAPGEAVEEVLSPMAAPEALQVEAAVTPEPVAAFEPEPMAAFEPEPGPIPEPVEEAVAAVPVPVAPAAEALHIARPTVTLARLCIQQEDYPTAVAILERIIDEQPANQEARDLLDLVNDMLEAGPAEELRPLRPRERKIAALQRWLASLTLGRERWLS